MTELLEVIQSLQHNGVRFSVAGDKLRVSYECPSSELPRIKAALDTVRACKSQAIEILRCKQIPGSAILVAPRYDGIGKPLLSVPMCWCCKTPWTLDRLHEWTGKTYAFLKPGCGCLDVPQALSCCFLCVDHCQCKVRTVKTSAQKVSQDVFRTPQGDGDFR